MDQSSLSETQVGMAFTGFMIAYTVFQLPAGWQSMFLISALPALVIGILWLRFGRNHPEDHPHISREELRHVGIPCASAPR